MTRPATTSSSISPQPTFANMSGRAVADRSDGQGDPASVADHLDRCGLADLELADGDDELVGVGHVAATHLDHHVVLQDAALLGGTAGLDVGDLRAGGQV